MNWVKQVKSWGTMGSAGAMFAALLGVLVWRNRFLFTTPVHELGDSGANSIFITQAKGFGLLVGNYSRLGFNHPGPAYLYVEAAGEWLFHDLLGLVATPWNGQVLALLVLNAATFAAVFTVMRRWIPAGFAFLAMFGFVAYQPGIVTSTWMPFVYVPTFLLLIVAAASVIAGRAQDLWLAGLAGGLLIHGHVVFVLFASVIMAAAAGVAAFKRTGRPRDWLPAIAVLALFAAPILANTLLHWPGEIGKYLAYGSSEAAGSRSLPLSLGYVYRYWWPVQSVPWWAGLPFVAALIFFAVRIKEPFVRAGLRLGAVATLLLLYYAYAGIDNTADPYMGYFYWGVTLFVIAAVGSRWRSFPEPAAIACVIAIGLLAPGFRTSTHDHNPNLPATLGTLQRHADGRPIVFLTAAHGLGMDLPGLVQGAARRGQRACVLDERWAFLVSREFVCTPSEVVAGALLERREITPGDPPRKGELARIGHSAFGVPGEWSLS